MIRQITNKQIQAAQKKILAQLMVDQIFWNLVRKLHSPMLNITFNPLYSKI